MQERLQDSPFVQFIQEQASIKASRKTHCEDILRIVDAKYPQTDLHQLTASFVQQVGDDAVLENLLKRICVTSTLEEARTTLLTWAGENDLKPYGALSHLRFPG